jgi:hypothetical protein
MNLGKMPRNNGICSWKFIFCNLRL